MNKTLKSIISIVLCMATLVFIGCAKTTPETPSISEKPTESAQAAPENNSESEVTEEAESRTVTDALGKEVTVPGKVENIAIISTMPLASVYCMAGGDPAKLVALTPSSKNAAVNSFLNLVAPELENISTAFAEGESINIEELLNLNPDVIFYNIDDPVGVEAVGKLEMMGVPCVGFDTRISNTIETFNNWATLVGQVLGTETEVEQIVKYGYEVEQMVIDRVSAIPEEDRKSAIILSNYNEAMIQVAGSTFGRYWLSTVGAINPAEGIEQKIAPVSLEQIYEWDPDVILLNSFSAFTAEQVMNNAAIEGHDWSGLTAVKNGEFYKMPLGMYYWFPPCSDSPLALIWIAKHVYPEQFADIDMDAEIKDFYSRFYGIELTDDDMLKLYNPPAESAMG